MLKEVSKLAKVVINEDQCVGCGLCVNLCEDVFELDDDVAKVKGGDTTNKELKSAIDGCPTNCISIKE